MTLNEIADHNCKEAESLAQPDWKLDCRHTRPDGFWLESE